MPDGRSRGLFPSSRDHLFPRAGDRYQNTTAFVWVMVAIYPIGVPLFSFLVLFCHRRRIDPKVDAAAEHREMIRGSGDLLRVASTKQMELDIEKRDEDPALAWFTFLFEEYEPSCWWHAAPRGGLGF